MHFTQPQMKLQQLPGDLHHQILGDEAALQGPTLELHCHLPDWIYIIKYGNQTMHKSETLEITIPQSSKGQVRTKGFLA